MYVQKMILQQPIILDLNKFLYTVQLSQLVLTYVTEIYNWTRYFEFNL